MSAKQNQAQNCIDNIFKYSSTSSAAPKCKVVLFNIFGANSKLHTNSQQIACAAQLELSVGDTQKHKLFTNTALPWFRQGIWFPLTHMVSIQSITAVIITLFYLSRWAVCWENNASWNVLQNIWFFSTQRIFCDKGHWMFFKVLCLQCI